MSDSFLRALLPGAGLVLGVVTSTETCREAQRRHELGATSAIALGRVMTAAVLLAHIQNRTGMLSLQVLGSGRIKQVVADVTETGDVRGYIKPTHLALPRLTGEKVGGRRAIGHAVRSGILSVIRTAEDESFVHSTSDLVSGEVDADVEGFLAKSDQISSALAIDVLLGEDDAVHVAGGVLVQALPEGDLVRLEQLRAELRDRGIAATLETNGGDPLALLAHIVPEARFIDEPLEIRWKCRCSRERVLGALRLLDSAELADMVNSRETASVTCDFCGTTYEVGPDDVQRVFDSTVRGEG